jgi:hypothetical protein
MGGGVTTEKCNHDGVSDCRFDASEKNSNTWSCGYVRNCEDSPAGSRDRSVNRRFSSICFWMCAASWAIHLDLSGREGDDAAPD